MLSNMFICVIFTKSYHSNDQQIINERMKAIQQPNMSESIIHSKANKTVLNLGITKEPKFFDDLESKLLNTSKFQSYIWNEHYF